MGCWLAFKHAVLFAVSMQLWLCSGEYRRCRPSATTPPLSPIKDTTNWTSNELDADEGHHAPKIHSLALQELYASQCEKCPQHLSPPETTLRLLSNKTRAVVLLTHAATLSQALVLAAGLLTSGSRVTIVLGSSNPGIPDQRTIRSRLFAHIPCSNHVVASILLTFNRFSLDDGDHDKTLNRCALGSTSSAATASGSGTGSSGSHSNHHNRKHQSAGDILWCSLQTALPTAQTLARELSHLASLPAVLIVDASFVAGLLVAERLRLPAILLVATAADYLPPILGRGPAVAPRATAAATTTSHHGWWTPLRTWFRVVATGLHDRLAALDLTSAFMALNRVRSQLQLGRVRRLADVWQASGNVLLSSDPQALLWQDSLPHVRILVDPLVPPCIPCLPTTSATHAPMIDRQPVVLVSVDFNRDSKVGRFQSRRLLQALELTRASLRELAQTDSTPSRCHAPFLNNTTHRDNCLPYWHRRLNFTAVFPSTPTWPDVPPDFVLVEDTNFLDSLARHQPMAVISSCTEGTMGTVTLGPPVLCLDWSWSARATALHLLQLWSNQKPAALHSGTRPNLPDGGLEHIVTTIEQIGLLRDRYYQTWQNGLDMNRHLQRHFSQAEGVPLASSSQSGGWLETFWVVISWLICITTALYIWFKDNATLWQRFRLRRSHYFRNPIPILSAVTDEMNLVVTLCSTWTVEQMQQWEKLGVVATEASDDARESTEHHGHLARRKRHPLKKRH
jgi:hypothetical protein